MCGYASVIVGEDASTEVNWDASANGNGRLSIVYKNHR